MKHLSQGIPANTCLITFSDLTLVDGDETCSSLFFSTLDLISTSNWMSWRPFCRYRIDSKLQQCQLISNARLHRSRRVNTRRKKRNFSSTGMKMQILCLLRNIFASSSVWFFYFFFSLPLRRVQKTPQHKTREKPEKILADHLH